MMRSRTAVPCGVRNRITYSHVAVAVAVSLLTACEQGGSTDADRTVTVTASHVIGSSESIARVLDLTVLTDSSVWVLNSVEPFFIGFDSQGRLIGEHGKSGGGPEEFPFPSAFLSEGLADGAWVLDLRRQAFIDVSNPDGPWTELPIPADSFPAGSLRGGLDMMSPAVRTARMGSTIILPRTRGSMASGVYSFRMAVLGADLLALDPREGSVRTVVSLRDVLDDPSEGFEATDGGFPLWYRLWDVCGDDEIRVYDRVRNQLPGFTSRGVALSPVDLPPVQLLEVSAREFARAVFSLRQAEATGGVGSRLSAADSTRLLNEMVQGVQGEPPELAAYLPRFVDFRCSTDGSMWLQPIDLEAGGLRGGRLWIHVARDGTASDVRLPERFDALRFTADRIWGVQRDQLDVASVAWLDLPN